MVTDLLVGILLPGPFGHGSVKRVLQTFESSLEGIEAIPVVRMGHHLTWCINIILVRWDR